MQTVHTAQYIYIYNIYIYIKQSTNRIWAKDRNGHLSKESIQMDIKHMKRCSGSLLVKCHSKLQWGVNLPLSEWPSSKSESINHSVCLTLCNPIDCSLPGSSVHGNSLGKNTEVVCMISTRGSSQPRDQSQVSRLASKCFTIWATREALSLQKIYKRFSAAEGKGDRGSSYTVSEMYMGGCSHEGERCGDSLKHQIQSDHLIWQAHSLSSIQRKS